MLVRRLCHRGEEVPCRIVPGGRLERAGQRSRVRDAVEPKGSILTDIRIAPMTYHRPAWLTSPNGCRARTLRLPLREVYWSEIGRCWRTASATVSSTSACGAGKSSGSVVKAGTGVRRPAGPRSATAGRAGFRGGSLTRRTCSRRQPGTAAGNQAEQDGQGFVVAEHQRRQTIAGGEPIPAVAPAHRLHWHVEVDQVTHVAPHRARFDTEALGELGHCPDAAGLQEPSSASTWAVGRAMV